MKQQATVVNIGLFVLVLSVVIRVGVEVDGRSLVWISEGLVGRKAMLNQVVLQKLPQDTKISNPMICPLEISKVRTG